MVNSSTLSQQSSIDETVCMKHFSWQLSQFLQLFLKLQTKCYMNSQPSSISSFMFLQNQAKYRQLFKQQRPTMFKQLVTAGKSNPKTLRILQRSERLKACDRSDFESLYAAILQKTSTIDGNRTKQDLTAMVISVIQLQSHYYILENEGISIDQREFRISMLQLLVRRAWKIMVKVFMIAGEVDAVGRLAISAENVWLRVPGLGKMRLQQS